MKRIDVLLVSHANIKSRAQAQSFIQQGLVFVSVAGLWQPVKKPSEKYADTCLITVKDSPEQHFVSRAALKLEAALPLIAEPLAGKLALDVGQSTGGFTDCLLQHGIGHVVGVDVGHSQLVAALKENERVTALENYNARNLHIDDLPERVKQGVDFVVMDVSFISQHLILPRLPAVMKAGAILISLVKPQFEVGRENIGKNGLVKNASGYDAVKKSIIEKLQTLKFEVLDYIESPITGGDGNREFIAIARFLKD
ncbi:TlyA family RNA methyltransferase [Teredinibacter purpureus]|uniref:TlyA family RNA methyltransferase n=1 Tax=Teredinibacter purpureus TaxID=2731756 RepID=UPI0005F77B4D|nr:TlyA family RNA methyltransferase [Teredinibacter purpureus]